MGWSLIHENERRALGRGRVIGRADFKGAPALSREHLRFELTDGRLAVRDLGSRHGTSLNGRPLTAQTSRSLAVGDVLRVGAHEFRIAWTWPHRSVGALTVTFVLLMKVLDPAAALGRAIGGYGWIAFVASALLATLLASVLAHVLTPGRDARIYGAGVLVLAMAFDLGLLLAAGRRTPILERVGRARVDYHCVTHFTAGACAEQVSLCPKCAMGVDKWQREAIARQLESSNRRPAGVER